MPLHFAYGSNMDVPAMAARCPRSRPIGPARLLRHRLVISPDGYADVMRDPRATVHGLLWDLALTDVPALDRHENVAGGLYTKMQQTVATATGPRRALIYVGRGIGAGRPRPGYLAGVIAAGRAAGLPDEYLRDVQHLAR